MELVEMLPLSLFLNIFVKQIGNKCFHKNVLLLRRCFIYTTRETYENSPTILPFFFSISEKGAVFLFASILLMSVVFLGHIDQ